jgi:hypothetical protein
MPYQNNFQFVDMKQQNRFIMNIQTYYEQNVDSYLIKTTDLPSVENNPVVVDTINAEYKIKGKSRWQDISVTFYDPLETLTLSGAQVAHDWMSIDHHDSVNNVDQYMSTYKKKITLYYVDPTGATGAFWELNGAFFANINWGSLDVSSDDLVAIDATISYDWAEYFPG